MDPVSQAVPQLTHVTPRQIEHAPQAPAKADTRERERKEEIRTQAMEKARNSAGQRQRQQKPVQAAEPEPASDGPWQDETAAPARPRVNGGATGPAPKSAFDIARQRAASSTRR